MITFMFPGQGSQAPGMGGDLFDEFDELTEKADSILGYSVKKLCLEDSNNDLGKTQYTQPAIYVVNALSYFKMIRETGQKPDYVVGHSLGEFNALLAAGCFDFEAGLKMVKKRGELMSEARNGGMAAILNASKEQIENILDENKLAGIDLANFNSRSQIVISGEKSDIIKAQSLFQTGKMLYYPLNTSGAFHSHHMKSARNKFEQYLRKFKLSELSIPVVANVTARPYTHDEILSVLSSQISNPVRWSESIDYLIEVGKSSNDPMTFKELGHGNVLSGLVQKIMEERDQLDTEKSDLAVREPLQEHSLIQQDSDSDAPKTACSIDEDDNNDKQPRSHPKNSRPQSGITADQKVQDWNSNHPIGTKVSSSILEDEDLETRTEAVVLFGHRAAVYIKGYNGYFDLDEVTAK